MPILSSSRIQFEFLNSMKSAQSFCKFLSSSLFIVSCVACAYRPPEDSASGNVYDQCMSNVKLMEIAAGTRGRKMIRQAKEYCSCSAKILWESERDWGLSSFDDRKTGSKIFDQCATDKMIEERREQERIEAARERERDEFIDSIDLLFR